MKPLVIGWMSLFCLQSIFGCTMFGKRPQSKATISAIPKDELPESVKQSLASFVSKIDLPPYSPNIWDCKDASQLIHTKCDEARESRTDILNCSSMSMRCTYSDGSKISHALNIITLAGPPTVHCMIDNGGDKDHHPTFEASKCWPASTPDSLTPEVVVPIVRSHVCYFATSIKTEVRDRERASNHPKNYDCAKRESSYETCIDCCEYHTKNYDGLCTGSDEVLRKDCPWILDCRGSCKNYFQKR